MKITVNEALSGKLQDRMKLKQLDQFISNLPCLGKDLMALTVKEMQENGIGYGVGNGTKDEQESAAKDIYGDFDKYITWSVKPDDNGEEYYITAEIKPKTWDLPLDDLKQLFELLDDSLKPYC